MARARSPNSIEAEEMYKRGMKLVDIAKKLDVPASTVRRWKSTQNWDGDTKKEKNERSQKKKTSARHKGGQLGNKNAVGNKGGPLKPGDQTGKEFLIRSYRNYPWNCVLRYKESTSGSATVTSDVEKKQNTVAYVARFTKDCKCYSVAGKTQAKMFPVIKKNAVVDVMKYTETVNGKKWYFIRIPHPTEGFVREFVPAGYFKKLI